jgi:PKD repeat protein
VAVAMALLLLGTIAAFGPGCSAEPADFQGREGEPTELKVTVDAGGPVDLYRWDFEGNGTYDWNSTESPNTTHTYAAAGIYHAVLEAQLANGNKTHWIFSVSILPANLPPVVSVLKGPDGYLRTDRLSDLALDGVAADADGEVVLYEWDFEGDGNIDWSSTDGAFVSHRYAEIGTHDAVLRATDDGGAWGEDSVQVEVRNLPPDLGREGDIVTSEPVADLTVTAEDPDGQVISFTWDFGDGSPVVETMAPASSHDYGGSGRWMVEVVAMDNEGANSTTVFWVEVTEPSGEDPPSVDAGEDVVTEVGKAVQFEADATAGSAPIANYSWDLDGDGTEDAEGRLQTYAYDTPGTYLVRVTVTDSNGLTAEDTTTVVVHPEVNLAPVPVPSVEQWVRPGRSLDFRELSYDPDGRIVLYQWDFEGNGTFDYASDVNGNTSHVYPEEGIYAAVLLVTDNRGEVNSTSITIKVSTDAPGEDDEVDDTQGATVCCLAIIVALAIMVYWTMRKSLATPRKDMRREVDERGGGDEVDEEEEVEEASEEPTGD